MIIGRHLAHTRGMKMLNSQPSVCTDHSHSSRACVGSDFPCPHHQFIKANRNWPVRIWLRSSCLQFTTEARNGFFTWGGNMKPSNYIVTKTNNHPWKSQVLDLYMWEVTVLAHSFQITTMSSKENVWKSLLSVYKYRAKAIEYKIAYKLFLEQRNIWWEGNKRINGKENKGKLKDSN